MEKIYKITPETLKKIWSIYHFVSYVVALVLKTFIGEDPTEFSRYSEILNFAEDSVKDFRKKFEI